MKVFAYLSNGSVEHYHMDCPEIGHCSVRNGFDYDGIGFANHCGYCYGDDSDDWYEDEHMYHYDDVVAIYFGHECVYHNTKYVVSLDDIVAEAYLAEDEFYAELTSREYDPMDHWYDDQEP